MVFKNMSKKLIAYCYRSGQIGFTTAKPPAGTIVLVKGDPKKVRARVMVCSRESYPTKRGGKDTVQLVPGVPEAEDEMAALDAVEKFIKFLNL